MPKEINSDLLRGNINTIILSALYSGDRYGYDIVSEIEQKSHGQFSIKQPTLYSCLKRLEAQGYVSSYWGEQSNGGRRKYFSLTDLGRQVFKQSQDDYEYSRTVIDKLISENKYDLGDQPIAQTETLSASGQNELNANNDENINGAVSSSAVQSHDTFEENRTEQIAFSDLDKHFSDDSQQNISESAVETKPENSYNQSVAEDKAEETRGDGGKFLPPDFGRRSSHSDNDSVFQPYSVASESSESSSAENARSGDISWFDAGIAKQNDNQDETEDIRDIFNRNSVDNSYIDDIKTGEIKKSNNIFNQSASDADFESLASTQFGDDYSEADYPYADSSDSAADAIEAELSPLKEEKNNFIRYHEGDEVQKAGAAAQAEIESSSIPGNEYQNVLTEMIDKFDTNGSEITKNDIANNALELNDRVSVRAFGNIVDSARELGEEIVVRTNDNSAKHQYSVKYYYNDSLLRLVICGILFGIMLIESLVTYIVCKNIVGSAGRFDALTFVLTVLVSLAIPVVAAIKYYSNPRSKKRIENNLMDTFWFKFVVMLLICLLAFGINLFMGMPLSSSITDYSVTLFMPMILSTNLPLSYLLFRLLYTKKFFTAKE